MTAPLPAWTAAAFVLLGASFALLWAPRWSAAPRAPTWWTAAFALSLACAVAGGLVNPIGLMAVLLFAAACRAARLATSTGLSVAAHVVMLGLSAALLVHVIPGFDNPRWLDGVRLSADSVPYTKYLNFDKGVVGLFLLGLYAPTLTARRSRLGPAGWLWRFAMMSAVVMAATVALGYARWNPKLPEWWPLWLLSMVFLTALPEEAIFRGVIQQRLHDSLGDFAARRGLAAVIAGALFGAAHAGGGGVYVALAALAGIGYGWIYAVSGAIGASVLAHTGLNVLHLLFFSYPALSR